MLKSTLKFHIKGTNVKAWSRRNGFKPDTVNRVLQGYNGYKGEGPVGQAIRKALQRDGFLPKRRGRKRVS